MDHQENALSSQLIPLIGKLMEAVQATGGKSIDLALPQIVVVGSQSAGKSSVLENIVGQSILPRGTGIVTRVPLVMQLHAPSADELAAALADRANPAGSQQDEWGEFLHLPGQRFFDWDAVRAEVASRTDALAGTDRGVVDAPIHLKVNAPRLLELTLVDLPGVTRVPVGDQPADIEQQVRSLCLKYIENENSIILAITAANTDLSNSDALQLAKLVDPHGRRTVGVLTKVDLMDHGTDCVDVLMNRVLPLELGFVAVVNRGQRDIQNHVGVAAALQSEQAFFAQHDVYGSPRARACNLAASLGTPCLVARLSRTLHACIARVLPSLRAKVQALLRDTADARQALGVAVPERDLKRCCLDQLGEFSLRFRDSLEGTVDVLDAYAYDDDEAAEAGLGGGLGGRTGVAAITHVFDEVFASSIEAIDALDGLSDAYIRRVIENSNSLPPSLFVPEKAFIALVKEQIARLEQPGIQCVEMIHERLLAIATRCQKGSAGGTAARFPLLAQRIEALVAEQLGPLAHSCKAKVRDLIDSELAYINTKHPDFMDCQSTFLPILAGQLQLAAQVAATAAGAAAGVPALVSAAAPAAADESRFVSRLSPPPKPRGSDDDDGGFEDCYSGAQSDAHHGQQPGGPFWKGWFGGQGQQRGLEPVPQPRPRRGGRRSSFGILDPSELGAFREHQSQQQQQQQQQQSQPVAGPPRAGTKVAQPAPLTRKELEVALVQNLIRSYFDIVARDFCDKVPKQIMAFMVNKLKDSLQNELITALYEDATVERLMAEPPEVAHQRRAVAVREQTLLQAASLLSDARAFALPPGLAAAAAPPPLLAAGHAYASGATSATGAASDAPSFGALRSYNAAPRVSNYGGKPVANPLAAIAGKRPTARGQKENAVAGIGESF